MANYLRQKEFAMTVQTKPNDTTINMESLMTVIFVIVDDWYQQQGLKLLKGKPGSKAEFSDSELITLVLCMDIIPFPSERQFYQFIRANYLSLFPRLIDRSQFNRRAEQRRPGQSPVLLVSHIEETHEAWHAHAEARLDDLAKRAALVVLHETVRPGGGWRCLAAIISHKCFGDGIPMQQKRAASDSG